MLRPVPVHEAIVALQVGQDCPAPYSSLRECGSGIATDNPLGYHAPIRTVAEAFANGRASHCERVTYGLRRSRSFAFTSGCQLAHVTALAAARRYLLLGCGHDPEREGLGTAPQLHVITGIHGHHSVDRVVRILGIGSKHLHLVPTTAGRLDVPALAELLTKLESAPVVVCLSAGDITTGNFDDFRTVIPLCRSRGNTWVHVDGAFGLWAKVSPHFAHLLEGVEEADSWATDAHKWLNTPFDGRPSMQSSGCSPLWRSRSERHDA